MFVFRFADIAQLAEHVIGNDEVGGSNPPISSKAASSAEVAAFSFCRLLIEKKFRGTLQKAPLCKGSSHSFAATERLLYFMTTLFLKNEHSETES